MRRALAWWVAGGALVVVAVLVLVVSTSDVERTSAVAGSTPARVLVPAQQGPGPVIVLAHGFSGSAAMMDPMATALARAGFVVVAPDMPGHGGNGTPLTEGALDRAVTEAVGLARSLADGGEVAVVGHSMGARAVTDWAVRNPASATVAISLPDAAGLPRDPSRPANLLLLWGSAEPQRFVDAALTGLRLGYAGAEPGRTYGEKEEGTGRRAVRISGAEHISVIYRQQTFDEVATWLTPTSAATNPRGDARLLGVLLALAGALVLSRPVLARPVLARPLLARSSHAGPGDGRSVRRGAPGAAGPAVRFLILIGAAVGAALGAAALQGMTDLVPVAVSGYLAGWFGVGAVILWFTSRRLTARTGGMRGLGRGALAGIGLTLAMAVPARLSWAAFEPSSTRWLVFVPLIGSMGAWFWAEWRVIDGVGGRRRTMLLVASRAIVVVVLLAGVALLGAPGFLTLTVPVLVPVLLLLAVLAGWAGDPLAAAAAQAVPAAALVATTFPIVG